jgi:signal transduction histidine kinase
MQLTANPPRAAAPVVVVPAMKAGTLAFRPIHNEVGAIVDLVCTKLDEGATAILHQQADEVLSRSIMDIHPRDVEATLFRSYAKVVETGEPLKIETEYIHKGQPLTWSILATREADDLVLRISDTTEHQRQAALLKERDQLNSTGRFVRLLGHEVRNPLTNILLALEELESEGPLTDDQALHLAMVRRNAERIDQLIRELLNTSREIEVKMVPATLFGVLADAVAIVKDRCALHGAQCTLKVEPDLDEVPMERSALTIAITNLLVNALEAMEDGKGQLDVHAERLMDRMLVTVKDNGKGMTQEDRERIFQPFYSGRKNGLGLGLTESRNIFNAHGILLTVESGAGTGTAFKLLFPKPTATEGLGGTVQ